MTASALGSIFSASVGGLMAGYLLLAPLSGRTGHRRLIICSVAWFGVLTLLCAIANSAPQLLVLRFLTGGGLGAAISSAVALASEYAPARRRSTFGLLRRALDGGVVRAALPELAVQLGIWLRRRGQAPSAVTVTVRYAGNDCWANTGRDAREDRLVAEQAVDRLRSTFGARVIGPATLHRPVS
ncbi:MFS transporter [Streptomyces sp. NPDC050534]|uniref:MFS transporter n=1 Tax=Streptomyces sp. NPDC050534 TaxID=3365625 RepID=UPI0037AAF75C